jgi:hypothetical protein
VAGKARHDAHSRRPGRSVFSAVDGGDGHSFSSGFEAVSTFFATLEILSLPLGKT